MLETMTCPECRQLVQFSDQLAGLYAKCPAFGGRIKLPAARSATQIQGATSAPRRYGEPSLPAPPNWQRADGDFLFRHDTIGAELAPGWATVATGPGLVRWG